MKETPASPYGDDSVRTVIARREQQDFNFTGLTTRWRTSIAQGHFG
jgi:hypothetical protein